jgi:hypothetical protein
MGDGLRLEGTMIPRRVRRIFDQRSEARATVPALADVECRGARLEVQLVNLSASGAMIACPAEVHIGERLLLAIPGDEPRAAVVRWAREGRIGLHFEPSVG